MKIVFLVISYMPHRLVSIKSVIKMQGAEVHSFSYKDAHTIPQEIENLHTYELKDFSRKELLNRILEINPEIIVVAGWAVKDYVWVAKQIKKRLNIPIISNSDTQWRNTWKQKINAIISPWHLKKAFTHLWVAGIYQFEYARKLGFKKNKIIYNSLSCDTELFNKVSLDQKLLAYPKNFLFIGRFIEVKGLDLLIEAWKQIPDKNGWTLTLIGDGPIKEQFQNIEKVVIKNFMPQSELIKEIKRAGCFILPSVFEPWALVIHEAAVAGLPIIATNVCGAAPHFVVSGYNGFQVNVNSKSIKHAMENIIALSSTQLYQFSLNSKYLAKNITPELGTAQLMSVLDNN